MVFDYKQVIITRQDLKLSKGKLAAQVAHASVLCSNIARGSHKEWYNKWIQEGQKKVVLKVSNKEEMIKYYMISKQAGIPSCMITDAGHTEIPSGTLTVAGIGPAPDDVIDKITGDLELL
ncbi:MAG: peptidyl-tRNA hydrolase Pth2 [Candidatus Methanofastidiosia archaeon]